MQTRTGHGPERGEAVIFRSSNQLCFRIGVFLLVALFWIFAPPAVQAAAPHFIEGQPVTSDAGNFALAWQADGPVSVELIDKSGRMAPRVVYKGSNKATFVSGLPDGEYQARLRDGTGSLAQTLTLTVEHQSLTRAMWLVAIGALAFLATVAVIVRGARDE